MVLTRHLGVRTVAARSGPRAGYVVQDMQKSCRALVTKARWVFLKREESGVSDGPLRSFGSRLGLLIS